MPFSPNSARGLPDRSDFGDFSKLQRGQILDWVIQRHLAQRSGPHYDVRFGDPNMGLLSWATKKELPEPGDRPTALFQQPVHAHSYGKFQGTIPTGYGAGRVLRHDMGKVLITDISPQGINLTLAHKQFPERFLLVPPNKTDSKQWLLVNTTKTQPLGVEKQKFTSIPTDQIEPVLQQLQPGQSVSAKLDGASALVSLLKDHIEVASYRTSKRQPGAPIVHTERVFGERPHVDIPKHLQQTDLRAETIGLDQKGKAIPPQALGGILNATIVNSLAMQKGQNVKLHNVLYDIAKFGGKPVDHLPRSERLEMLKSVLPHLPADRFSLAEEVNTPDAALELLNQVRSGKHPLTREGVVIQSETGRPQKAKLLDETDVHVTGSFPGEGKYQGRGIGGFTYSDAPGGQPVGRVGTGLSDQLRLSAYANPQDYVGRVARISSQGTFPSGAHRAPSLLALHEDYPLAKASCIVSNTTARALVRLAAIKYAELKPTTTLQPHQSQVVSQMADTDKMMLYHSLGSGKTLSAIAAAESSGLPYTAVVPAALRENFRKEQKRWTTTPTDDASPLSYNAVASGKQPPPGGFVIFDEAHRLRNPDTQTAQASRQIADHAKKVLLLTGSPVVNQPSDLANAVNILTGSNQSPEGFEHEYVGHHKVWPGLWPWLRGIRSGDEPMLQNEKELAGQLRGHVNYFKPSTPPVESHEQEIRVDMGPEQTQLYQRLWGKAPPWVRWKLKRDFPLSPEEQQRLTSFLSGPRQMAISPFTAMATPDAAKAFAMSPKLQRASQEMDKVLSDPRAKALVFSNFVQAGLVPYLQHLQEKKIPAALYHGGLSDSARRTMVDDYNTGKLRALLLGPAGGEGLSLRQTRLIQLLEPHWNETRADQQKGRGIRFDSHTDLPAESQNVAIQRFVSQLPRTLFRRSDKARATTDDYLKNLSARKEKLNDEFRGLLRRVGSER